MIKKLIRHGNSFAIIIDKPLMQLLNIDKNTELDISVKNGCLIVHPIVKKKRHSKKEIKDIAQEIKNKHADLFKKLAQSEREDLK